MNELDHPNKNDRPQGTVVSWSNENPEQIVVIVWTGYAPSTGEYVGTRAIFSVNEESKTLTLESVSVKYPYRLWEDMLLYPQTTYVSDRMKRAVRAFIAKEKGSAYWRVIDQR